MLGREQVCLQARSVECFVDVVKFERYEIRCKQNLCGCSCDGRTSSTTQCTGFITSSLKFTHIPVGILGYIRRPHLLFVHSNIIEYVCCNEQRSVFALIRQPRNLCVRSLEHFGLCSLQRTYEWQLIKCSLKRTFLKMFVITNRTHQGYREAIRDNER